MQAIVMASTGGDPATQVAVDSWREHHPGTDVTVVVCDPLARDSIAAGDGVAGAKTVLARHLLVGELRYIDVWMAGGDAFARWAVIPAVIEHLGVRATTLVVPSHSWFLGDTADRLGQIDNTGFGLFPLIHDADADVSSGGWLADMVVIGPEAVPVLRRWTEVATNAALGRLREFDMEDPWNEFVSGGAALTTLGDPGLRLTPATVGSLALADSSIETNAGFTVDGEPLRLAQFPGFDPRRPWWYAASADDIPLVLASVSPALRRLGLAYADLWPSPAPPPIPTEFAPMGPPGVPMSASLREAFRSQLSSALGDGSAVPNPLDPDTVDVFFDWLRGPGAPDGTGVNLAVDLLWRERPDLAGVFPHVRWRDRAAFLRWLWTHGLASGLVTTALLPPVPRSTPITGPGIASKVFGVNLVGYHDAELGLGVAVRRVGAALDAARIPWTKVSYDRTNSRSRRRSAASADAPYWFNLILIAPDQLQFFLDDIGADFFDGHYNIGLWFWETDAMTERQLAAFDNVDEVWGSTAYLRDVFAAHTDKPVTHLPVPLEFAVTDTTENERARERLGLDDRFTFLFSFDFLSIVERKNPLGLAKAYRSAFAIDDGCRLILKSINGDLHAFEAEEIRAAISDRPDIELWDRYLDGPDRLALVAEVDCYVSLHRSEGLGLTMAEAMAAGTPVIATAYSGNLDFMDDESALLVGYDEVEIGDGSFYPADGHWAEPDLDQAAVLMRRINTDDGLRSRLAKAGPVALRPFTSKRVGAAISARLDTLWR